MTQFVDTLAGIFQSSGFARFAEPGGWLYAVMICVGCFLLYLAIVKEFEPLILLPMAFGMILANLPGSGVIHMQYFVGDGLEHPMWLEILNNGGLADMLYLGVKLGIYPPLIFLGIGTMTDFAPLISNPKSLLLGAAAQFGIFGTYMGARLLSATGIVDFSQAQSAAIAIIGGASAFVESTLAQIYKRRDPETGESYGGPSYYIEAALHSRPLAIIFAFSLILTYAGGFNMLASYNLQSTFSGYSFYNAESTPWVIGAILAVLVGYCVMGGGKRIIKFTSTLVPFMGGLYVLVSLVVLVMNIGNLPYVFGRIFSEAFDFQAIFSGFAGSAMMYGIKRGLYSNEAGVGSAPNAAASANVSHPVKQGLVQMLSVFIDTLLICTATAFMLLCSGVEPDAALEGAPYVQAALSAVFGPIGPMFITVAMVLFAFTTLIGNLYYVDNCLNYIVKKVPAKEFMVLFRIDAMLLIFIGAGMQIGTVWNLADVLMGVMALINLPVIILLSRPALLALKDYTAQKNTGRNPVFKAETVGLKGKTEYWN